MNRKDVYQMGLLLCQCGIDNLEDATQAVQTGARFLAHGFTHAEIGDMIRYQYKQWADAEEAVSSGTATLKQYRRWREMNRDD